MNALVEPSATFDVLGVRISALTPEATLEILRNRVACRRRTLVAVCNVHSIVEASREPLFAQALEAADLATPDGMPLVWWGRSLAGARVSRVYGPDLLGAALTDPACRTRRHFFYGGTPAVLEKLIATARRLNPDLQLAGAIAPPFRPLDAAEEARTLEAINAAKPDFVWVGLGCPKQEIWMARVRPRLEAPVILGVGAAFDFLAGVKPQAPRILQRAGLEWLFRLATEPRRLWRRYLVFNTVFLVRTLGHVLGGRVRAATAGR